MEHYEVQLMGGSVIMNGMLAEMETGEGKTLTATLPACTAALAGIPVHVITTNGYLAERDAEIMRPAYEILGLTVGSVREGESDEQERRNAYACDVTYCTNKDIAFDYLRDRISRAGQGSHDGFERLGDSAAPRRATLLRGLCFGIVDEADSVLVDEAGTPLILSRAVDAAGLEEISRQALEIAASLEEGRDFALDRRHRSVQLSDAGEERIAECCEPLEGVWAGARRRRELIRQAVQATSLFIRDDHYLVRDGKVEIIDANTGRSMPDRSWEAGLHQMIEVKEGCEVTGLKETLARTSYQDFYRRYLRLGGMTGTAREVVGELWSVYGLRAVRIPPRLPVQRIDQGTRIFASADEKWAAVGERVGELVASGRPVLIGTQSLASSEELSRRLGAAGCDHQLLNARQDRDEAELIGRAGERHRVTIATNMAGRGTDIKLGDGVVELAGLHVIAAELSPARRIDRQLYGRCGRQGDPGSYEVVLSLEDPIVIDSLSPTLRAALARRLVSATSFWAAVARFWVARMQKSIERRHARARRGLLRMEESLKTALAFGGRPQ
jgi:preprotein translocase subunit SecA